MNLRIALRRAGMGAMGIEIVGEQTFRHPEQRCRMRDLRWPR
jgi:hypothetical protein